MLLVQGLIVCVCVCVCGEWELIWKAVNSSCLHAHHLHTICAHAHTCSLSRRWWKGAEDGAYVFIFLCTYVLYMFVHI